MKPIELTIIEAQDHDIRTYAIVEDRGTGVDIRLAREPVLTASEEIAVDVTRGHCDTCRGLVSLAEVIGLTSGEVATIAQWRDRKAKGIPSAKLGKILDKIVAAIKAPGIRCPDDYERILIRVESSNG